MAPVKTTLVAVATENAECVEEAGGCCWNVTDMISCCRLIVNDNQLTSVLGRAVDDTGTDLSYL